MVKLTCKLDHINELFDLVDYLVDTFGDSLDLRKNEIPNCLFSGNNEWQFDIPTTDKFSEKDRLLLMIKFDKIEVL